MAELSFYLDENIPTAIAEQLKRSNIRVYTARELGQLGVADETHLDKVTALGCVLCTFDTDFAVLHKASLSQTERVPHAGIIIGQPEKHGIGQWVKGLKLYHTIYTAEAMIDQIEYL